jgi:Excalibur calcium-binding domain
VVVLAACGTDDGAGTASTSVTEPSTTTSAGTTSTSEPATTTTSRPPATTLTTAATTTTEPENEMVTVESVVDSIQQWLKQSFAESDPPEGVLGPIQLQCLDSGPVGAGDVFACAGIPKTEPDFPLDPVGVVVYVVDDSGTAAWTSGTDVPDVTSSLETLYGESPKGMLCRDLLSPDFASWFSAAGATPQFGFFVSLLYWSLEGQPERMDADGDGIPCETLYESEVAQGILDGGPVGQ